MAHHFGLLFGDLRLVGITAEQIVSFDFDFVFLFLLAEKGRRKNIYIYIIYTMRLLFFFWPFFSILRSIYVFDCSTSYL